MRSYDSLDILCSCTQGSIKTFRNTVYCLWFSVLIPIRNSKHWTLPLCTGIDDDVKVWTPTAEQAAGLSASVLALVEANSSRDRRSNTVTTLVFYPPQPAHMSSPALTSVAISGDSLTLVISDVSCSSEAMYPLATWHEHRHQCSEALSSLQ